MGFNQGHVVQELKKVLTDFGMAGEEFFNIYRLTMIEPVQVIRDERIEYVFVGHGLLFVIEQFTERPQATLEIPGRCVR